MVLVVVVGLVVVEEAVEVVEEAVEVFVEVVRGTPSVSAISTKHATTNH